MKFEGPLPTRRSIQVHEVLDCHHHPREHHNKLQRPAAVYGICAGAEGSPGGNEDAGGWLRWSLARAIAVGSDRSFQELREIFCFPPTHPGFFVNDSFFVLTRTWHSLRLTTHSRHPCLSGLSLGKLPGAPGLTAARGLPYPLLIGCSRVGLDLREYASV